MNGIGEGWGVDHNCRDFTTLYKMAGNSKVE
jgi:hypothetical protein